MHDRSRPRDQPVIARPAAALAVPAPRQAAVAPVAGAVQMFADAVTAGVHVQEAAAHGLSGASGALPHGAAIQRAFGRHDVGGIQAHVGGRAAEGAAAMGAHGYASGNAVAFASSPDLHLAAHEAAHVVQQRAGVQLSGGVGAAGDPYERHADAVADLVVQGKSAEPLLDEMAPTGNATVAVQRRERVEREPVAGLSVAQGALAQATPEQLTEIRDQLQHAAHAATETVPVQFHAGGDHYQLTLRRDDIAVLEDEVRAAQQHATPPHGPALPTTGRPLGIEPMDAAQMLAGSGAGPLSSAADSRIRIAEYVEPTRRFSDQILADVNAGRLSPEAGARAAALERTRLRGLTRSMVSPSARAQSRMIEPDGPNPEVTFRQLCDAKALRMLEESPALRARFGIETAVAEDAATLRAIEEMRGSEEVMRAVIASAGRTNPAMTGSARFMRVAAPVMVGTQVALGGYRVLSADEGEHMYTAGEEISGFAGATVGAMAGSAIVSFLAAFAVGAGFSIGAPATIILGLAIVGGMQMAGDTEGRNIWDQLVDQHAMHNAEMAIEHALQTFAQASAGDRIAAATSASALAAGGGYGGLADRDRRRTEEAVHDRGDGTEPQTSGGEAPPVY